MDDTDKTLENITTSNMCGNHKSLYGDGQQYHQYNKKVESVGYRSLIIEPKNTTTKYSVNFNIN
jgi:hypothetical protein